MAGVFFTPASTFERLLKRPTWWLPFVIFMVVGGSAFLLMTTRIDWDRSAQDVLDKQAERSGSTAPAGAADRVAPMMRAWALISAPLVLAGQFFLVSLILWGAARLFAGEIRYGEALALWGHANLVNVLATLFGIAIVMQLPPASVPLSGLERVVKSNVAAFLPDDAPAALVALASSLDVFALGALALLVIGFRRIPGLARAAATAIPIGLWLVYVLGRTGLATLRS